MSDLMPGMRVRGEAGVFYADRPAEGEVLNLIGPWRLPSGETEVLVHVLLDDGDRAVVPVESVVPA